MVKKLIVKEKEYLCTFLLCIITILVIWWLVGWRPSYLTQYVDASDVLVPLLQEMQRFEGYSIDLLYRIDLLGGTKIRDTFGFIPILQFCTWFGIGPIDTINITTFFIQIIFSFLGVYAVRELATIFGQFIISPSYSLTLHWSAKIPLIALLAFAPFVILRLIVGHTYFLCSFFLFIAPFTLILATRTKRLSISLLVVSFLAMIHSFPNGGQQIIFYSLIFGGPIFLAILLSGPITTFSKENIVTASKNLFPAIVVVLAALAYSMPDYLPLISHALGPDTPRSTTSQAVFSFNIASYKEWLTCIPWTGEFSRTIPPSYEHETNYPIGPVLLFLLALPWKRFRFLLFTLILSGFFVVAFSMKMEPIASLLMILLPPLKAFRVPARAILPFIFSLLIVAFALILFFFNTKIENQKNSGIGWLIVAVLCYCLLAVFSNVQREIFSWILALLSIVVIKVKPNFSKYITSSAILTLLASCSIASCYERIPKFFNVKNSLQHVAQTSQIVQKTYPFLKNPLNRARLDFRLSLYKKNTPLMLGVSSLDGYWVPSKRFLQLLFALQGSNFTITKTNFDLHPNDLSFPVLQQLYNIKCLLFLKNGHITKKSLALTPGPVWLSKELVPQKNFAILAKTLHLVKLSKFAKNKILVLEKDFPQKIPLTHKKGKQNKILFVNIAQNQQEITIALKNLEATFLVVSMNYVSNLHAYIAATKQSLSIFPAYGALVGMYVPAKAKEIKIQIKVPDPLWPKIVQCLGILMLFMLIGVLQKKHFFEY